MNPVPDELRDPFLDTYHVGGCPSPEEMKARHRRAFATPRMESLLVLPKNFGDF